jgi:hypothetical protein
MSVATLIVCMFSVIFSKSAHAAPTYPTDFECGTYLMVGQLVSTSKSLDILKLYPGTTSETPIRLSGISTEDMLAYDGDSMELEVRITRPGHGSATRGEWIKFGGPVTEDKLRHHPVQKIKDLPCEKATTPKR